VSKYEPDWEQVSDGVWITTYPHQIRQQDAEAALREVEHLESSIVLWVMDGDRTVAKVHRTLRDEELQYVIRVAPPRAVTPDLHRINQEQERHGDKRIHHSRDAIIDPLMAPDDRDLEVSTADGIVRLDRAKIALAIHHGQDTVALQDVRFIHG
jgi:hypothetical protein